MKSYIGITGFMSRSEVEEVLKSVPVSADRLVMIGVLVNRKTVTGFQVKWPGRHPKIEMVADIFVDDPRVLNLVHYNTSEREGFKEQLREIIIHGGPNLHGFQLNMAWPNPATLRGFRLLLGPCHSDLKIVLQVSGRAFEMVGHSPERLAEKVAREYGRGRTIVSHILLDPSGGRGKSFDPERMREYLEALKAKDLDIGLGVAGGLGPDTLHLAEPLVRDFPDLSIDTEGRLRNQDDHLDVKLASEYLRRAFQMFNM